KMRHPTEILRIATHHYTILNLLQHRHCQWYLTLGLLQSHLQRNLHLPGPWHASNRAPEMIQAIEVRWTCKGFFKQFCIEYPVQAKRPQISTQMAIGDCIPESGMEDQAIGIYSTLCLGCLT